MKYDIAVVGAGAAGLTAAIFAKRTAPDARIGGFNFQWAWASGRLAGIHAAQSLK